MTTLPFLSLILPSSPPPLPSTSCVTAVICMPKRFCKRLAGGGDRRRREQDCAGYKEPAPLLSYIPEFFLLLKPRTQRSSHEEHTAEDAGRPDVCADRLR